MEITVRLQGSHEGLYLIVGSPVNPNDPVFRRIYREQLDLRGRPYWAFLGPHESAEIRPWLIKALYEPWPADF